MKINYKDLKTPCYINGIYKYCIYFNEKTGFKEYQEIK